MSSLERVVLAGGGTAGHVSPLLATAEELVARHPGVKVTAVGSPKGIEERLVPARGFDLDLVPKVAFPRRPNAAALRFPSSFVSALKKADAIIAERRPQVVVGFGGYVCPPMYLAARKAGIPVVIHEQNARPGLANKLGARFAHAVAVTFPSTPMKGADVVGMPLRQEIVALDRAALRPEGLAHFGLEPGLPTIVVTGGSLGAKSINDAFEATASELSQAGIQVLHVTGTGKAFTPPQTSGGARYVVVEYVDRMDLAYAVADLVVTRSGAGMVSELTAVGLPAVYVPLPIGNGEQKLNSRDVVAAGGALSVDNSDFTATWVRQNVIPLVEDAARLDSMRSASASCGRRDAAAALADLVEHAALSPQGPAPSK